MRTATDTLTSAGWRQAANDLWLAPLNGRLFAEREAPALASVEPRSRNPIYQPPKFTRQ